MMMMRIEKDALGEKEIPKNALYGIQTARAVENFPVTGYRIDRDFIIAFAYVKLACLYTNEELGYLPTEISSPAKLACEDIISGKFHEAIIVDPFQGGAGTSTNMNFNEVIANIALLKKGLEPGLYSCIHPLNHINMHQSTNDVYPTALKVAILLKLKKLEQETIRFQQALQDKETAFKSIVKIARTELQDAIPMTLGMEFAAFAEATARDRWRIFKSRERIKTVNLGGTAIGTGLAAPRDYIFKVTDRLRQLTGLTLSRSENLVDTTQNLDCFVEVSAILKAQATNLMKIANDLRLLSSGPSCGLNEITLPPRQAGSTIMPGKINPVIPESIIQCAMQTIANDQTVALVSASGQLELNHLIPLLAFCLLQSLQLLTEANRIATDYCIIGISVNSDQCAHYIQNSKAIATVLVPLIGYEETEKIVYHATKENISIWDAIRQANIMSEEHLQDLLSPKRMYKLGFTPEDKLR